MKDLPNCTECGSEFTYEDGNMYVCPECGHEWMDSLESEEQEAAVRDAYGNILQNGDSVVVMKDIKVKGMPTAIKVGVKVKNIRLVDPIDGHNFEGKVPGFGMLMLKSELVKKVMGA